jgi:hypothetical protein
LWNQSKIQNRKSKIVSPDYSIRPRQHIRRNGQSDLLGCLEIDHQLEFRRLLDRKIRPLGAFEDFIGVNRRANFFSPTVRYDVNY